MPDLSGTEALKLLREDSRTAAIPVVALTSSTMQGDEQRFIAQGSTATSQSRSACASSPTRCGVPGTSAETRAPLRGSSWSTTCRRTCGCSRRSSSRPASRCPGVVRAGGARARRRRAARPRAARRPDGRDERLRGLPPAARGRGDRVPPRRDGHLARQRGAHRRHPRPAPTTSSRSPSTSRSYSLASARWSASSATTTRSRPGRRARRARTGRSRRASRAGRGARRMARLRRFLSPTLAEVVLDAGRRACSRATAASSPSSSPTCAAGPTSARHRAGGGDGRHRRLPRRDGELILEFEATVGWFAGDGLMVWFNDPIPCDDPAARAVRMAVDDARGDVGADGGMARSAATSSTSRSASRSATRRSAGSASRAATTTARSAAS